MDETISLIHSITIYRIPTIYGVPAILLGERNQKSWPALGGLERKMEM